MKTLHEERFQGSTQSLCPALPCRNGSSFSSIFVHTLTCKLSVRTALWAPGMNKQTNKTWNCQRTEWLRSLCCFSPSLFGARITNETFLQLLDPQTHIFLRTVKSVAQILQPHPHGGQAVKCPLCLGEELAAPGDRHLRFGAVLV